MHVKLSGVTAISAGASPVTAVLAGGTVWSWGAGAGGLLGNGAVADSDLPVQVSDVAGALSTGDGANAAYAIQPG